MRKNITPNPWNSILIGIVCIGGFIFGMTRAPRPQRLLPLRAPDHVATLAYSGPLILPQLSNKSVLGAQAIDPIDFVDDINKERLKVGSPALRLNTTLMAAARMRADVIKKYQNFSHQDPHEGIELGTVLPKLNYHFIYASENIGMGGGSAADFVSGFMHSDHHRENLLDPRLTETGAAFADGPYFQYYVSYAVQMFAIPAGRDEYLGYNDQDKTKYIATLTSVRGNLNPLLWIVGRLRRDPRYTDTYYKKLARQRDILETVVPHMQKSAPLTNRDVALILEYNTLLPS